MATGREWWLRAGRIGPIADSSIRILAVWLRARDSEHRSGNRFVDVAGVKSKLVKQTMTGDELKFLRRTFDLSRPVVARMIGRHSDTIRYWERKSCLSHEQGVPALILQALDIKSFDLSLFITNAYYRFLCVNGFRSQMRERERAHLGLIKYFEVREGSAGRIRKRPRCGAKTRAGGTCKAKVVDGKRRCRMHGGLSTGPKTEAGRRRISEAQQLR